MKNIISRLLLITYIFVLFSFSVEIKAISNAYIDCRTASVTTAGDIFHRTEKGRFVIGVPPSTQLLFGYPDAQWSSFTTIYIQDPGNTLTIFGSAAGQWLPISVPVDNYDAANNSRNTSTWKKSGIQVTQNLTIVKNPVTLNHFDTIQMQYIVENTNSFTARVGIRILLDTQLGGNDNSPIIVQGAGKISKQQEWVGAAVPNAWYTLDNYQAPTIRAQATLNGPGAVKPDRLIIGQWDYSSETAALWTYAVTPVDITDTVAAIFWDPVSISAATSNTFTSYFGIQDAIGAELSIAKSVNSTAVHYNDTLSYNLICSNLYNIPLTGLVVWDSIPWNTTFVDASPGYSLSGRSIIWTLPDINDTSTTYSTWFRVKVNDGQGIYVTNTAEGGYTDTYWDDIEYRGSNMAQSDIATLTPSASPTISATFTISPTHTITPTATITPTFTATPPVLTLKLLSNFPNPAKNFTGILFNLTSPAQVNIRIYTISGEFVKQLSGKFEKGNNSLRWDLQNTIGGNAASGTYIYSIEAVSTRGEKQKKEGQMAVVR